MDRPCPATDRLKARLLGFLLPHAADGFAEAVEVQFAVPGYPLLIGAIFPLAQILLTLDRAAPQEAEVQATVAHLVESLVLLGDDDGWRYFNLCPEIPPDSDDLAHLITVLCARDHPERGRLLVGPLRRLAENVQAPGRYRTWLTTSPESAREADARWASGADPVHPEVMANLLHALLLLDADTWRRDILAGADWLAGLQEAGLWASYWYYGHGYGTHLVLRLFAGIGRRWPEEAPRFAAAQHAARDALVGTQRHDGSWGAVRPPMGVVELGGSWDPPEGRALETALCLSALSQLRSDPSTRAARDRAIAYLEESQAPDGGFEAEPYYFTMGLMPHQSRCLTSSAVLDSLSSDGQ